MANWLGCYDAADWIGRVLAERASRAACADGTCGQPRAVGKVTWLEAGPSAMNQSLKRYIDGTDDVWTCWTFDRPGQENYRLVGTAKSRGHATLWVEGWSHTP